jgi:uncharacterized protein (TIGR00297 family)
MIERAVAGLVLAVLISGAGWRMGALSARGAMASVAVGTATIAGASWLGGLLLGAFFVSSSALSKRNTSATEAAKGSTRDVRQVLANGGIAALAALASPWTGMGAAVVLVAGPLAAATADTWATEIGSRSGRVPRLILSRRTVPVGVSGGITTPGTLGSLGGAASIGLVAAFGMAVVSGTSEAIVAFAVVSAAGVVGSLADSVLGEVAQRRRWCPTCDQWTEALVHRCGSDTAHRGGLAWVDNDVVNLACTTTGLLVAALGLLFLW